MIPTFYIRDIIDKRIIKNNCIRKLTKHYESLNMKYVCDNLITDEEIYNNKDYKKYKDDKTGLTFVLKFDNFEHPDIGSEWYCNKDITECFKYNQHSNDNKTTLLSYAIGIN